MKAEQNKQGSHKSAVKTVAMANKINHYTSLREKKPPTQIQYSTDVDTTSMTPTKAEKKAS